MLGLHETSTIKPTASRKIIRLSAIAVTLVVAACKAGPPQLPAIEVTAPTRVEPTPAAPPSVEVAETARATTTLKAQEPTVRKPSQTQTKPVNSTALNSTAEVAEKTVKTPQPIEPRKAAKQNIALPQPVIVDSISRTGQLDNPKLTEVSGITHSRNSPGVIYAINDSGDSATLYALSERGKHIGQWSIEARNRDWEELDIVALNSRNYILIGDTGDNGQRHRQSRFYLVEEPLPGSAPDKPLTPFMTINFAYEDGPRNVEAFAVHGKTIYMISKEPLSANGARASRLYALRIPSTQPQNTLTAQFLAELPIARPSLESKIAASLASVDLDHFTAMDISSSGLTAYLLTYREVQKIERTKNESWAAAFQRRGKRIHTHKLGQAEALSIAPGRAVFITAESRRAPLWAIPIQAAP